MWRIVGSVLLGYVVMASLVFASFGVAYLLVGTEGAFKPGSYEISGTWIVVSFVLGFLAAIAGGWVAMAVGRTDIAPKVLAGLVVVLGLLVAIPALSDNRPTEPRTEATGTFEAMQNAEQPLWITLLNPLVGAAGVLLGMRLNRRRASA